MALFLMSLLGSGCREQSASPTIVSTIIPPQSPEMQTAELRQKLRKISTADGISKSEAELIAECYFHQNVGCGSFTSIQDRGFFWNVEGQAGYAGQPITGFHIDKRTGKITSPIGPSYATPSQIFP